jgi:ergothioneine biosynthesis protein EgtB
MLQSMADASPLKWHLAHTTWFFEEFVLSPFERDHRWRNDTWRILFNSYYRSVGPRHERAARGLLSRPSLDEVQGWRKSVDERMLSLLETADEEVLARTLLGTHHEEQHQELILTDIKHALSGNPLCPAYLSDASPGRGDGENAPLAWITFEDAAVDIGSGSGSFAFDNETPRHRVLVGAFAMASRLVSNGEYMAFVDDGGYQRPELWLADGWNTIQSDGWSAPLYWQHRNGVPDWQVFGLRGLHALDPHAPVSHVSYYEADAYARWMGARLPTEQEWERVARSRAVEGNFVECGLYQPAPTSDRAMSQLFGDAWEWTASAYLPYPRFRPLQGALGEYNAKFMSGQMVLRGGSCFSPRDHLRAGYRNFFAPSARWQMTGIRLARDT